MPFNCCSSSCIIQCWLASSLLMFIFGNAKCACLGSFQRENVQCEFQQMNFIWDINIYLHIFFFYFRGCDSAISPFYVYECQRKLWRNRHLRASKTLRFSTIRKLSEKNIQKHDQSYQQADIPNKRTIQCYFSFSSLSNIVLNKKSWLWKSGCLYAATVYRIPW